MTGESTFPAFPEGFRWGVATSAYQIEGAVNTNGRGASIWDVFSHRPGAVDNGDTGDVACDHYHRYREDIALMRELGIDSYRFSVAWPRVQPDGSGPANSAGLDFYSRLVEELLAAGIEPCLTLYHWDLPQRLEDSGGWRDRDTASRFAEYAAIVHERLGDRVRLWTTLNEPFCSAFLGYAEGRHAPGAREGHGALAAAHHLLLGHGAATAAMRAQRHGGESFGITLNMNPVTPVSDSPEDVAAARRYECYQNLAFSDPVLGGTYPDVERAVWGEITDFSFRRDGDLELIGTDLDFLGVNNYFPGYVRAAPYESVDPKLRTADDIGAELDPPESLGRTTMDWPVEAAGLSRLLRWLDERYPGLPPIYVTENGTSGFDAPDGDGEVHDAHRIDYLDSHLRELRDAIRAGVSVHGYYCWSLLDNFEWAEGYKQRFGLVYVDYESQRRIRKDSFDWYRRAVARSREPDDSLIV
ncbi:beta-glucosidase [Actinopolyspora erythraea]|uniref:Beta-glucosidase n=1 Tax=Actinopolyspora erythraea TaxID=414996 RepID=A0A223RSB3_9ACTN|nr:GH1 family beta-glucosidase [Actinopolyspora erythraea]ASU78765.1 beta-glucosidase [Actinopolyspora erythraea]